MARGKKGYEKTVRTVNKGQSADKKVKTVHKMVETEAFVQAMIKGDLKSAEDALGKRMQQLIRSKVMGEGVVDLEIEDDSGEYSDDEGSMDDMGDEGGEYSDDDEGGCGCDSSEGGDMGSGEYDDEGGEDELDLDAEEGDEYDDEDELSL